MVRNTELFEKIAAQIEEQPWRYDQETWGEELRGQHLCTTAHCIAGWALMLSGYTFDVDDECFYDPNREEVSDEALEAADLLGLNLQEAKRLFHTDWMQDRESEVPDRLRGIANGAIIFYD